MHLAVTYDTFQSSFFLFFFFFWLCLTTCRILVPQPGIKPMPLAGEVWSLIHWTAREVPRWHLNSTLMYILNIYFIIIRVKLRVPLVSQMVKNPPAVQETQVPSLGLEDPLERGMATHSSIPAWRIPWTEQSGRLYSSWGCKESDMAEWLTLSHFHTGVKKGRKKALSLKYKWKDKGKLRQKMNCKSLKSKKISNTKTVFWNIEAKNKIIIVKEVMGSEGEGRRIIDFVFAK